MKCTKCRGTGNIKTKKPVILNWIVGTIGFIFGPFLVEQRITEKRPGYVQEVKTCPKCNGTGKV